MSEFDSKKARRKSYVDLKYQFIRGLIDEEWKQRKSHFLKSAAEWTSKAIVSLELAEEPVKSLKQATHLEGIGGEIARKLKRISNEGHFSNQQPLKGMFISSGPAFLVALLNAAESMVDKDSSIADVLVAEVVLKARTEMICEEKFIENPEANAICPATWRLMVLCNRGYIKRRLQSKQNVYQLLPAGIEIAERLGGSMKAGPKQTGYHDQNSQPTEINALYSNDDGTDGITLIVDTQEGGGERNKLGEFIELINQAGLRYQTHHLLCGDYSWLWRCAGLAKTLPVVVERKRADDLAKSLVDGRYDKQKVKLLKWKEQFNGKGVDVSLKYLIEGKVEDYVVRCSDGCGGVSKCGYPTVQQINVVIDELEKDTDFDVLRTDSVQTTVELLGMMTQDLQLRLDNGQFDNLLMNDATVVQEPTANKKDKVTLPQDDIEVVTIEAQAAQYLPYDLQKTTEQGDGNKNKSSLAQYHTGFGVSIGFPGKSSLGKSRQDFVPHNPVHSPLTVKSYKPPPKPLSVVKGNTGESAGIYGDTERRKRKRYSTILPTFDDLYSDLERNNNQSRGKEGLFSEFSDHDSDVEEHWTDELQCKDKHWQNTLSGMVKSKTVVSDLKEFKKLDVASPKRKMLKITPSASFVMSMPELSDTAKPRTKKTQRSNPSFKRMVVAGFESDESDSSDEELIEPKKKTVTATYTRAINQSSATYNPKAYFEEDDSSDYGEFGELKQKHAINTRVIKWSSNIMKGNNSDDEDYIPTHYDGSDKKLDKPRKRWNTTDKKKSSTITSYSADTEGENLFYDDDDEIICDVKSSQNTISFNNKKSMDQSDLRKVVPGDPSTSAVVLKKNEEKQYSAVEFVDNSKTFPKKKSYVEEAKVDNIAAILPHLDKEVIRQSLEKYVGNVEIALDDLLHCS